jgi:hypothetical protein
MTDSKFTPEDEIPVEDLEKACGAGIPVTSQQTGNRQPLGEVQDGEDRQSDRVESNPDPWKQKPT